ncbi:hypothetical protein [Sulfobacillus thermosulfidooxidans]|uniref:hypothetical protein n=1 Tax=Sulfobacillus thermosulfidooxidans TaxID=28034 RepID=UPI000426E34D|nr:hypothetical protein [Sulfobacillus thermosulfidooxidans]
MVQMAKEISLEPRTYLQYLSEQLPRRDLSRLLTLVARLTGPRERAAPTVSYLNQTHSQRKVDII